MQQNGTGRIRPPPGPIRGPCREAGGSPRRERQRRYIGHGAGCVPLRRRGRAGNSSRAAQVGRQRHRPLFLALAPRGGHGESHCVPLGMLSATPAPTLVPSGDGPCCGGCQDPRPPLPPAEAEVIAWPVSPCHSGGCCGVGATANGGSWDRPSSVTLCPQDTPGSCRPRSVLRTRPGSVGADPQLPLPRAGSCTQCPCSPACSGGFRLPQLGSSPLRPGTEAAGSPAPVCSSVSPPGRTWTPCSRTTSAS